MELLGIKARDAASKAIVADRISAMIRSRLDDIGLSEVAVSSDEHSGGFEDSIDFRFTCGQRRLPMLLAIDDTGGSVVNSATETAIPVAGKYYGVADIQTLLSAAIATVWWHVSGKNMTVH